MLADSKVGGEKKKRSRGWGGGKQSFLEAFQESSPKSSSNLEGEFGEVERLIRNASSVGSSGLGHCAERVTRCRRL